MRDQRVAIHDERNLLERLIQRVPGFKGYFDRENRRQADAVLRAFAVDHLDRVIRALDDHKCRAELQDLETWQGAKKQVEIARNELRHADQGYSGFFDERKLDTPAALDALYRFDEEIVERVEALVLAVERDEAGGEDLLEEASALRRALTDRKNKILAHSEE